MIKIRLWYKDYDLGSKMISRKELNKQKILEVFDIIITCDYYKEMNLIIKSPKSELVDSILNEYKKRKCIDLEFTSDPISPSLETLKKRLKVIK